MIIEAKRTEKIDVVIDPINVLAELARDFRAEWGVPQNAVVKAGYWVIDQPDSVGENWYEKDRLRLATVEEMEVMNALRKVASFIVKND